MNTTQSSSIFKIRIEEKILTVVIASLDEVSTKEFYDTILQDTKETVHHIAYAGKKSRVQYPKGVTVYQCPLFHNAKLRKQKILKFWRACREAANKKQAVVIHGKQSLHTAYLLLAAIMVLAGAEQDYVMLEIALLRSIYAQHTKMFENNSEEKQAAKDVHKILEAHNFVNNLASDTLDDKNMNDVNCQTCIEHDSSAIIAPPGLDDQYCSGCNISTSSLLECWECGEWNCRVCSYWCTFCPKGVDYKYLICKECNFQSKKLQQKGKTWACQNCRKRYRKKKKAGRCNE